MDIIIGDVGGIGPSGQYTRDGEGPISIEASFLEITEKKEQTGSGRRPRGRVISLLIPEDQKIPRGLESGEYRIILRLVHRRHESF